MSTNQGLEAQEGEEERVRDIGRGREMCGCPFMLVLLCPFCLLQMKEGGYWRGAGREEKGERERRVRCLVLPSGQAALNQEP